MTISKSTYERYLKCPKGLWLHFFDRDKESALTGIQQQNIDNGLLVGDLARHYFPGTVDCTRTDDKNVPILKEQIQATKEAMENGADALAEASFMVGNLYCAVDVLKKDDDGYSIYEVKSVLDLKDEHYADVAFQKYVLEKAGVPVKHVFLMHPNRKYLLHGSLNIKDYFLVENQDNSKTVANYYADIADIIPKIEEILNKKDEPICDFHHNCKDCAFNEYCMRNIPEDSIGSLSGISAKAFDFYNKGIFTIEQYVKTAEYAKSAKHPRREIQIQKTLSKDTTPFIDRAKLQEFLDSIRYPIYHLDFETTKDIIPQIEGFRPNEEFPFQYSLHIESADGSIEHREFLGEEKNCLRALAEQLVRDIPKNSQLMAFNSSTEENKIKYLAKKFPDLAEHLLNLSENFIDLLHPFKEAFYFDPKQKGVNSIKNVMPALCPEMAEAYHDLPVIHNGGDALTIFPKMLAMKGTPAYDTVRNGMLKYCELDTFSMVKVMDALRNAVQP